MTAKTELVEVVAIRGYFPADGSEKMNKDDKRELPKSEALPLIKAGVLVRAEDL